MWRWLSFGAGLLFCTGCGNELEVTFTGLSGTRLSSLDLGITQGEVSLFSGAIALDGGSLDLPATLRVLVKTAEPVTVRANAVDWADLTRAGTATSGTLQRSSRLEVDLSEATVCPAPPARTNEVVVFDDETHGYDEFTYFMGPPRHVPQACSGTALELNTTNANDGIGFYLGRTMPQGVQQRRLSLRLWASRVGNVEIGFVTEGAQGVPYWLPMRTSVHELTPDWKSFTFDVPDTIPNTVSIHVHLAGMPTPVIVRVDDVRIVPR